MKLRIFLIVLISAALAGGGYAIKHFYFTEVPPVIISVPATRGDIEETVLATGLLKPAKLVAVGAQVSGRILRLTAKLGQEVKTGDEIAEIDSVTQVNNLRTAEAALANVQAQRAEKEATLARNLQTLARQQQMVARKAVSQADYETAEADVKVARAQISALDAEIIEAKVAVETAKANLGYTKITAPIDGTVLAVVSQEGQTVNASQSAPTIVVLGQLDTMTVRVEISEADIVNVHAGQEVSFNVLGEPDKSYSGKLEMIEPAPESIRSDSSISTSSSSSSSSSSTTSSAIYYIGVFDVPNPDRRLRTYMTAEVSIVVAEAKNVLTIPTSALGKRAKSGKYLVQVLADDGSIDKRQVSIGLNDKMVAEVIDGLSEGDRVVTGISNSDGTKAFRGAGRMMGL